jgi:mannosyltransferase OCH1-like enzyme
MDIGCSFQFSWFDVDGICVNCLIEFYLMFFSFYKDTNKYVYKQEKVKKLFLSDV